MSNLSEEKVLRVGCPGFGVSSILPLGEAKPLAMYEVIVVNPVSIVHLFDNKSEILQKIDTLQSDGITSIKPDNDGILGSIVAELDLRTQELVQFLKKGGLLVFFLCPPFTVEASPDSGLTPMDNYTWLGDWAPDKPSGPNLRNMSATIRGKTIDLSAEGQSSPFASYLKQAGVEWSTIIRNENLTDGFVPLALAGPNKCVAAVKDSGPKNGQIVFLPGPYDKSFDDGLRDGILRWWAIHEGEAPPPPQAVPESAPAADAAPAGSSTSENDEGVESLGSLLNSPKKTMTVPELEPLMAEKKPVNGADSQDKLAPVPEPEPSVLAEVSAAIAEVAAAPPLLDLLGDLPSVDEAFAQLEAQGAAERAAAEQAKTVEEAPPPAAEPFEPEAPTATPDGDGKPPAPEPQADKPAELIKKMEKGLTRSTVPEWCQTFSFTELDEMRQHLSDLTEDVRLAQIKLAELDSRIEVLDELKNNLLSASGEPLVSACTSVFEALEWTVKPAHGSQEEFWLCEGETTQVIVRLIHTTGQPNRSELAALAESVITYWGAHEIEPKGLLVCSTFCDLPPAERTQEDFPDSMVEFAKRKNLALLTTTQLLSVYRDVSITGANPSSIRDIIIKTLGQVPGYDLKLTDKPGAAAGKA